MTKPLAAWWWKLKNNYGDILNPYILEYVSGRPVEWCPPGQADMFAIGSIMSTVRQRIINGGDPVYVWGTGLMDPIEPDFNNSVAFSLVRGPLTATLLGMNFIPQGDPGLLADEAFDIGPVAKTHKYGIIAHWLHENKAEVAPLFSDLPNSKKISVITDDVAKTTKEIASCDIILSSSLHGLIVADSLGIPNVWIDTGDIGKTSRVKFLDYGLSVGRPMAAPIEIEQILTSGVPAPDTRYFAGLPAIKETIKEAFPQELVV